MSVEQLKEHTVAAIDVTGLRKAYGPLTAVDGLDLTVEAGEVVALLGPNGAGKTTTIRTLLDFIRPSSGSASIFGMYTVRDSVAIRRRIGYLPSELTLLDNWTGLDYVHWLETVRGATNGFVPEAQRLAERLGYDLTRSLKGLSTGMRRQMGLIVALAHKPELLRADHRPRSAGAPPHLAARAAASGAAGGHRPSDDALHGGGEHGSATG